MSYGGDGGCAFPVPEQKDANGITFIWADRGMTLRDYFAAAVLSGSGLGRSGMDPASIAVLAYSIADAMIAARNNR